MNRSQIGWVVVALAPAPWSARADDWPQWRGPDRNGVSKETGLLKKWPKGGPKLAWTFKDAGSGISSFAVVKGVVYTLGTRGKDEIVLALDAKNNGKELWNVKIGPIFDFKKNTWGVGPRSTPTVDGELLYALGGQGELVCVNIAKQGVVWRKNLIKDLGGVMMTEWGYSESPLVDGDLLICTPGGAKGTMAALDKKTGAVKWRSKEWTEKAPYSSAVAADIQGVRQYIQTGYTGGNKGGSIAGMSAKDGKLLWKETIFKGDSYAICPTPIVKGNLVYYTSGYEGVGCHLFEIDAKQKATDKYGREQNKSVKNSSGGVVLLDGCIYGHSEKSRWICQDLLTGNLNWEVTQPLNCKSGAVTAADGMLYLFTDEGEVGLAQVSPKEFKLISSFALPQRSKIPDQEVSSSKSKPWAHPVVANGLLLVRDLDLIFAFKVNGAPKK